MFAKVNIRESNLENMFFLLDKTRSDFNMTIGRFKTLTHARLASALFRRVSTIRRQSEIDRARNVPRQRMQEVKSSSPLAMITENE